jgi:S1-C subfamily serine protease
VRSRAGVVALALVLGACVPAPPATVATGADEVALAPLDLADVEEAEVLRRAREITVRIRSLGCDRLGVGSGFVLPGGLVVTNRHVVGQPLAVSINTWDGVSFEAEVDGVATDSDLAVLRLSDATSLPTAELRTAPVTIGEAIIVVGYPGGGPSTITTGRVLDVRPGEVFGEASDVIVVDAQVRPGNSGGPLLDAQGRVVGVVFALDPTSGVGLAVPIATLLERLTGAALSAPGGC